MAEAWPDAWREECASGGRRIDLETVKLMHFHQESDYWFDNETELAQIWELSQYLSHSVFTTTLVRLADRSFHSTLATSLILGWIANDPNFDQRRGGPACNGGRLGYTICFEMLGPVALRRNSIGEAYGATVPSLRKKASIGQSDHPSW